MGLLDLFRPKWKHSRAEVRLEAVREMSEDDLAVLREVARRDPESKIREAAMKRLPDAALLSELAGEEHDANLRELAARRASELSLRTAIDSTDANEALTAVQRIRDQKMLADVVRRASLERVRADALQRIDDQRALLDLVAKAEPSLREAALSKITEPKVLRDVALSESTTKALQQKAIEALSDAIMLRAVSERAKSKAIRAAAKQRMEALGIAEAPVTQKEKKTKKATDPTAETRLKQRKIEADLRRRAEEERKRSVGTKKSQLEAEHHERLRRTEMEEAAQRAEESTRAEREKQEAALKQKKREEREAERAAVSGETPEQQAERLKQRAERDAQRAAKDAERAEKAKENLSQLESLTERLEAQLEVTDSRISGAVMKEALSSSAARGPLPDGSEKLRERFDAARRTLAAKLSELREAEDWRRFANVPKLEALITRAESLAKVVIGAIKLEDGQELDAQKVSRELRAMQAQWKEIGPAPRDKADNLWERFKAATDIIYEGNKKSLDAVDEERVENLKMKEELCGRVEALVASPEAQTNPKLVSEQLKVMQEDWKKIGPVPRSENDKVWQRFRTACDQFFGARKAAFEKHDQDRGVVLEKQLELVKRAESLSTSQDWKGTADKLKQLQDDWKKLGAGKKPESDDAWTKFRAACDKFFEARKAQFAAQDEEREANLAKKNELVATVEKLAADESVVDVDAKIRELMGEWKKIGPVAKDKGDEVWARFGKALDALRTPSQPTPDELAHAQGGWFSNNAFAEKLKPQEDRAVPAPKKPAEKIEARATVPDPVPSKPADPPAPAPAPPEVPIGEPPQKPAEEPPQKEPIGDPAPQEPTAPTPVPQEVPDRQPEPPTPQDVPGSAPPTESPTVAQDAWPAPEDWSLPDDKK